MHLTFVHFTAFTKRWREFGLTDEDLQSLEQQLMERPEAGRVMQGTGGLRKTRFAPPSMNKGKSGAYRIGYVYFQSGDVIVLLVIFPKSEQPNLTAAEKAQFKKVIASLQL